MQNKTNANSYGQHVSAWSRSVNLAMQHITNARSDASRKCKDDTMKGECMPRGRVTSRVSEGDHGSAEIKHCQWLRIQHGNELGVGRIL
jgi:hypothetical protein